MSILTYWFGNKRTNKANTTNAAKKRKNLISKLSTAQNKDLRNESKKHQKATILGTNIVSETKSAKEAVNLGGGTRRVKHGKRKVTRRQGGGLTPEQMDRKTTVHNATAVALAARAKAAESLAASELELARVRQRKDRLEREAVAAAQVVSQMREEAVRLAADAREKQAAAARLRALAASELELASVRQRKDRLEREAAAAAQVVRQKREEAKKEVKEYDEDEDGDDEGHHENINWAERLREAAAKRIGQLKPRPQ